EVRGRNLDPARHMVSLSSDDIDADWRRLKAAGVEFVEDPTDYGTLRIATLKDPEGNLIQLLQPLQRNNSRGRWEWPPTPLPRSTPSASGGRRFGWGRDCASRYARAAWGQSARGCSVQRRQESRPPSASPPERWSSAPGFSGRIRGPI